MHRAPLPHRVFLHGAGRRGIAAWPSQDPESGTFLSFPPDSSISAQADALVASERDRKPNLFAHSIGAVTAVRALADGLRVSGLVLVEPALYDIARGAAPIERHIAVVTEARARAADDDLYGFWSILRPLMFGGPATRERWEDERAVAQRWATTNLPWGHGIRTRSLHGVPMLVVTGGWNEEYELIGRRLVDVGAHHVVLSGFAHRPQDHPDFPAAVAAFERSLAI
ncbi:alpha/beta hydrolase [Zhihengliuella sp. ISTPL4]|uniref:alpha/beta hydrolase n=1 Tax=Zhihengliuella sp. ISTPL4 TaxID=2058657 RepID=UPI000C7C00C4|nr:alpha/beta hydrolase [Zhihengliuella sp. ISTPL4]